MRRFNLQFGPVFPEPEAKLTTFRRVMGLDGVNKMSKSLNNHLELAASDEETRRRVMTMVTDTSRVYKRDPGHPEICNVYALHGFYSPERTEEIARDCRGAVLGCVDCKRLLAQNISVALAPFRARRAELAAQPELVEDVLAAGAKRARAIASATMAEVREHVGLLPRRE